MSFWQSCRKEEKIIFLLCGAVLIFCVGAEWGRQQKTLPPLFHAAPIPVTQSAPPKAR